MKKNKNKNKKKHGRSSSSRTNNNNSGRHRHDTLNANAVDDDTMMSSARPRYPHFHPVVLSVVFVVCFLMAVVVFGSSSSPFSASSSLSSSSVSPAPASLSSASTAIDSTEEQEPPAQETKDTTTATATAAATLLVKEEGWSILHTYPHDPTSFTQGLEIVLVADTALVDEEQRRAAVCTSTTTHEDNESTSGTCSEEEEKQEDGPKHGGQEAKHQYEQQQPQQHQQQHQHLIVESTGMHGDSILRMWNPQTGVIVHETKLAAQYFGEGVCRYTNSTTTNTTTTLPEEEATQRAWYVQLTWQEQTLVIYDARTLAVVHTIETWPSPTTTREGWGITWNPVDHVFYVSDGSHYLHVWDVNFHELSRIPVHMEELRDRTGQVYVAKKKTTTVVEEKGTTTTTTTLQQPISRLNELEYDVTTNTILANVLMEDLVVRIHPTTGWVSHIYDFSSLYPRDHRTPHEDVFNGIAIVPQTAGKEWYVTGKYWSTLYHLRIHGEE